jgi:hypothetical protein
MNSFGHFIGGPSGQVNNMAEGPSQDINGHSWWPFGDRSEKRFTSFNLEFFCRVHQASKKLRESK